jgi:hypothetical protein
MCFVSECSVEFWITEPFWIDLVLRNPLDAEVNLANMTVVLQQSSVQECSSADGFVEVEVVDNVVLAPKESQTVCRFQAPCDISDQNTRRFQYV